MRLLGPLSLLLAACASPGAPRLEARIERVSGHPDGALVQASVDGQLFPRLWLREGQPAEAFVGEVHPDGRADGYELRVLFHGKRALLILIEHDDGEAHVVLERSASVLRS